MKAGLLRRGCAFVLDIFVAVAPAMVLGLLPAMFVPLDRMDGVVALVLAPLVLAALAYIYFGAAIFANTYGRMAMGVRVVDQATGRRPRAGQAFLRMLTVGLWPVEAMLIAFSESGRRLGDRWAHTDVVRYDPAVSAWKRLLPGVVALALFAAPFAMMPAVIGRMDISRAAAAYARQELRIEPRGAPAHVITLDDYGAVTLRMADGHTVRVHLSREGDVWHGERIETIPREDLGWGFDIQRRTVGPRGQ